MGQRRPRSPHCRLRLWKVELQKLATETGLTICVAHHPPGTSKWNRIEHRMFSFITQNWRGKPLLTYKVIVQLIATTTTSSGLTLACAIHAGQYPKGGKVSKKLSSMPSRSDTITSIWNGTTPSFQSEPLDQALPNIEAVI
jgi:hypothetical protein